MSAAPPPQQAPSLASRLAGARVDLRPELQIIRHVFRGEPSYVVRDPASMQSFRLTAENYRVLVRISSERSLGEIFAMLVEDGVLSREDEAEFYRFVLTLHNLAFLSLPISDERALYQRWQAKQRARQKERALGFVSLRIPLWNPDHFLERTVPWMRWLYGRAAFVGWLLLMAVALWYAVQRFDELVRPAHGILDVANLPLLWATLIVLKVLHEFGHAYACKSRGGHVPEMGVMLILLTPLAYVDATSSWGFARRRDRIMVSVAGVYVESIIAAVALLVWATTPSPTVRIIAHNVVILASVVTVLLNLNPLMRFDGYYVLSDLLEIPNLRQRSERCVKAVLKRVLLGLHDPSPDGSRRFRAGLFAFGVAAIAYRVVIVLTISLLIATKAFLLGMVFAAVWIGTMLVGAVRGLVAYLWHAPETEDRRGRAIAVGVAVLAGLPLLAALLPVPASVRAGGVVEHRDEEVVRAEHAGFVADVKAREGQRVEAGTLLVRLENPLLEAAEREAEASLEVARLRASSFRATDPTRAVPEERTVAAREAQLAERRREVGALEVAADGPGLLVDVLAPQDRGRFVREGEPLARIGRGRFVVRVLLSESDVAEAEPAAGDRVRVRAAGAPGETLEGTVARIVPAGSREISQAALTHLAGGDIPVDPQGNVAGEPWFELEVELPGSDAAAVRDGMRAQVELAGQSETLARVLLRRLLRAGNRILQG